IDVRDLALATDGTKIAVSWTQTTQGTNQVYLREYSSGTWNELSGSASGKGISNSLGNAQAAKIAYFGGSLFAAWQDNASGHWAIYATRYNGAQWQWQSAGTSATTGQGVSSVDGEARLPSLVSSGAGLYLAWSHNRFYSEA